MASSPASPPIEHPRPAEGEAQELLGFQRVMRWMRVVGLGIVVAIAPLYDDASVPLLAMALCVVALTILAQGGLLDARLPLADLRVRARWLLASDLVAVYLIGTAFVASPDWVGYYFYPLVALEAAVVAGLWGGIAVTVANIAVYLGQVALHVGLGNPTSIREVLGSVALLGLMGGFTAMFGAAAQQGRRDMRVLLDLTAAMAHQQDETATIEVLDRRLQDAVGARVRSVAIRRDDGAFEIVRWHSSERRVVEPSAIEGSIGAVDALGARFAAGAALTWTVDPASPIAVSLGLPEWTRAITLVPIFVEGRWVAVLPVLWPSPTVPDTQRLQLLYGLANQMGLVLFQDQLHRIREEAATDPLTRLMNRRAILDELGAAVARATRSGRALSILFCDLDAFKRVNDTRGHAAGDAVLRTAAAAVRDALRHGDVVGRYGGDELLIVAADAGAAEAVVLADRVREAVRAATATDGVDITIGIGVHPDDGRTPGELLGAADRAMLEGKLRGSGQIVVAGATRPHGAPSGAGQPPGTGSQPVAG